MTGESAQFVRAPGVLHRFVSSEVLLAAPGVEDIDVLSDTGTVIWRLLEVPRTLLELTDELERMYSAPSDTVARGVEALMQQLTERGWVEVRDGYRSPTP